MNAPSAGYCDVRMMDRAERVIPPKAYESER
jgi:hypothetical protein